MKFNILSKVVAVFIALSIPSLFLVSQIVSEKNQSIKFAEKELKGSEYISNLVKILHNLHQHNIYQHKSRLFSLDKNKIRNLQYDIDKYIKNIDNLNKLYGDEFIRSEKIFSFFKRDWLTLKTKQDYFDIDKSEEVHQILIKNLISIIAEYSTESNLVLDLETDTHYLIDSSADKLVYAINNINKLQDLLTEIVSQKSSDLDQKTGVVIFTGIISDNIDKIKVQSNRAFSATDLKTLKASISPLITNLENNTNDFNNFSQSLVESKNISFSSIEEVESLSQKSATTALLLFGENIKQTNNLLEKRIQQLNSTKNRIVLLSSIIIGIYLLFGAYVVLGIVNAVRKLNTEAKKVSEGKLDVKTEINTGDELQSLSESFNTMLSNIRASFEVIENNNNLIAKGKEISDQNSRNMEMLIKETSSSVSKIKSFSEIVSDNAKLVAQSSTDVVDISAKGESAVNESIQGVEKIKEQIESVANKILELSEQTQEIGKIIESVNAIAVQSKFLAFNASIEASKAGEYGKGFSIVANEIKNLSEESDESTKRISEILNEIQQLTNESVMMAEESSKLADIGVNISRNAGESISQLVLTIQNSSEAAYQISSYAAEQQVNLEQLEETMKKAEFIKS